MSTQLPSKQELTKKFLELSNLPTDAVTLKRYLWVIWKNPISKTSLRLTEAGSSFLTEKLNITSYTYNLTDSAGEFTSKYLLILDKHISVPFYLVNRKKITFYGEEGAFMLVLHGGSLINYLNSINC